MIAAGMARALELNSPAAEGMDFFANAPEFIVVRQRENANSFLAAAIAFTAGFSERAIPELLEQMEKQLALSRKHKGTV